MKETLNPQVDGGYTDTELEDETDKDINSNVDNGIKLVDEEYGIHFLLTNARLLAPKLDSLKDAFQSLCLNFASITETWFRGDAALRNDLVDYEGLTGIKILHKSRDGKKKKSGGRAAFAFNSGNCNFKLRHLKHIRKETEILCVSGRVAKVDRVVVVFVVYLPPAIRSADLDAIREELAVEIDLSKQSLKNPIIIVNRDLNHRDISETLGDVDDFAVVQTGPTHGHNTIDLVYTNARGSVNPEGTRTLPPLLSGSGVDSDHRCGPEVELTVTTAAYTLKPWSYLRGTSSGSPT